MAARKSTRRLKCFRAYNEPLSAHAHPPNHVPHARRNPPTARRPGAYPVFRIAPHRALQTARGQAPPAPDRAGRPRHLRQRRAVRPLSPGNHHRHSGVAGRARHPYALQRAIDYRDALVVAISQSGESTDTNLVLSRAREQGALTIGITNEPSSTLARWPSTSFWCTPAGKKVWRPPRPTPARC
jgi:hypothetical protein